MMPPETAAGGGSQPIISEIGWKRQDRAALIVVILALIVIAIRDIHFPFLISILRVIKYPAAFVSLVLILPVFVASWRRAGPIQKRHVGLACLIFFCAFISAWLSEGTTSFSRLIYLAEWCFLVICGVIFVSSPGRIRLLLGGVVLLSLASLLIGLLEGPVPVQPSLVAFQDEPSLARFGGHGIDPNYFSMVLMLPVAYSFTISLDVGRRISVRLAGIFLLLLLGIAVIWTGSRSGMLSLALVLAVVVLSMGISRTGKSLILMSLVVGMLLVIFGGERLTGIADLAVNRWVAYHEGQDLSRTTVWIASLANVIEKPVWGWGPGAVEVLLRLGLYQGVGGWVKPHNAFILTAIERGLVGVVLVILLLSFSLVATFRLSRRKDNPVVSSLGVTLFAGICGQIAMSLTLGHFPVALFIVGACGVALEARMSAAGSMWQAG